MAKIGQLASVLPREQEDDDFVTGDQEERREREVDERQLARGARDQVEDLAPAVLALELVDARQHHGAGRLAEDADERQLRHADRVDGVASRTEGVADEQVMEGVLELDDE